MPTTRPVCSLCNASTLALMLCAILLAMQAHARTWDAFGSDGFRSFSVQAAPEADTLDPMIQEDEQDTPSNGHIDNPSEHLTETTDWPLFPEAPAGPSGEDITYGNPTAEWDGTWPEGLDGPPESVPSRRAPYPYYSDPWTINTEQPGAGRMAWVNAQVGYWHESGTRRGWSLKHRQAIDTMVLGLEHTQLYTAARGDAVLLPRIWGGAAIPLAGGYGYLGLGGSWIDDKAAFHSEFSLDVHARAEIYPVWPVGLESGLALSRYTNDRTTIDWDVSVKIQLFRAAFFQVGYRAIRVFDHSDELRADGFFFSLNLVFSNLATVFWGPNGGPADALVTLDFDG